MSDSDEEEEEFAVYGTPLDPLEEDVIQAKKPIQLQDQVATDKHGKRRFHGAFTGGFSAGFCNTVGSLEGWTPTPFKSSRSEKSSSAVSQKPSDFMDDEDMSEFGIAPKSIQVRSAFETNTGFDKKRFIPKSHDGPIPGTPVLESLLKPTVDTIGIKLLKRMGWKPGQGIGPRISKTEKNYQNKQEKLKHKIYGCSLPTNVNINEVTDEDDDDEDEEQDNETENDFTYAPNEYRNYLVKPKNNEFGLGYKGLDKRTILSNPKQGFNLFDNDDLPNSKQDGVTFIGKNNKKMKIHGQAFGVGAFEDEDEDIYEREDMSQYDFSLAPSGSKSKEKSTNKKVLQDKSNSSDVIDGFQLCSDQCLFMKIFPPPQLPQGYKPKPIQSVQISNTIIHPIDKSKSVFERAAILDEPLPIIRPQPSTTQSSSQSNTTPSNLIQNTMNDPSVPNESITDSSNTRNDSTVEQGVNNLSFKPFQTDPIKQKRYEQFICFLKIGQKDKLSNIQPSSMTEWEKQREAREFESAFKLYRPLSGDMADRFTRGSQPDDTNPLVQVEKSMAPGDETLKNAAKNKMFGKLTREVSTWIPSDLLCKRFNVKTPVFDYRNPIKSSERKKTRFSFFDFLNNPASTSDSNAASTSLDYNSTSDSNVLSSIVNIKTENEAEDQSPNDGTNFNDKTTKTTTEKNLEDIPLTAETKIDLFKAIFLSSDEEEDDEEEDKSKTDDKKSEEVQSNSNKDKTKTGTDNTEINVDKDILKINPMKEMDKEKTDNISHEKVDTNENNDELFGPKLPEPVNKTNTEEPIGEGKTVNETNDNNSIIKSKMRNDEVSLIKFQKPSKKIDETKQQKSSKEISNRVKVECIREEETEDDESEVTMESEVAMSETIIKAIKVEINEEEIIKKNEKDKGEESEDDIEWVDKDELEESENSEKEYKKHKRKHKNETDEGGGRSKKKIKKRHKDDSTDNSDGDSDVEFIGISKHKNNQPSKKKSKKEDENDKRYRDKDSKRHKNYKKKQNKSRKRKDSSDDEDKRSKSRKRNDSSDEDKRSKSRKRKDSSDSDSDYYEVRKRSSHKSKKIKKHKKDKHR